MNKKGAQMKHNKVLFLIFHVFVIMFVLILTNIFTAGENSDSMKFLEAVLLVLYIYTILTAKMYLDWLNSYMIFLYTLFLFNFTRVFLDIIGYRTFGWATKFANYYFYYSIRNEILEVFILILLFTHLGFAVSILNEKELHLGVKLETRPFLHKQELFYF